MNSSERKQASTLLPGSDDGSPAHSPEKQQQQDDDISAPPNGGFIAWVQVAGAWVITFNVLGLLNAYGQFQGIYETDLLRGSSASAIAWIGSAQFLVCYLVCVATGPVLDGGHLHLLLGVGTAVTVFGLMMTSLCHAYYQFFLAQTVVTGVGFGLVFLPASSVVSQWFSSRAPLAIGIAVSGSSVGAVVYPIMLQRLVGKVGFPWTVRIIGFMVLATMLFAAAVMRLRVGKSQQRRKEIDFGHVRDKFYLVACLSFFVNFLGLYVFYYYISLYATEVAGTDPHLAGYLLAILNAGSFFGRLLPSWLAGRWGLMNVQIVFGLISGALALALLGIRTTGGVVAFTAVYGFVSAPYVALPIPIVTSLSPDKGVWATRLGMSFAIIGLGALIGSPVAGAILGDGEDRNWTGLIVWCGVMFFTSAGILTILRTMKVGFKLFVIV
ncbi:Major facilitator superfamily domain, general substrate transporter [Cordyceps fumosorosea ARSEF 2679]|uniref:Major facilitator superfamily domain, general substrate transporter n=1 Tax=Cordyceps fumosorosea (strain ARSEF 2679) TaxID=1081104 RepID=A0A162N1K9_CORFA|nr:Major facilitator superfamily domain, general substrate transporter [Cordyceps fumosorosea ARSEF 2679]OAA74049.1 Major facilitator superfamily domain, general substrate transporter [Cordyceps fumosorosea ARSEF 2679]